jgi:hypothetical protein
MGPDETHTYFQEREQEYVTSNSTPPINKQLPVLRSRKHEEEGQGQPPGGKKKTKNKIAGRQESEEIGQCRQTTPSQ